MLPSGWPTRHGGSRAPWRSSRTSPTLLPELVIGITPEQLATLAAKAHGAEAGAAVGLEHLHAPRSASGSRPRCSSTGCARQPALTFRALHRRRRRDARRRRPVPRAAGAVPGGRGRVRPGHAAGRADDPLDRQRRGRGDGAATSSTSDDDAPTGQPSRAGDGRRTADGAHDRPRRTTDAAATTVERRPPATGRSTDAEPAAADEPASSTRRPAPVARVAPLEAVLMVVDEPVAEVALAPTSQLPAAAGVAAARRARGGVRRGGARVRAARGRRRLADLHPGRVRAASSSGSCSTASRRGSPRPRWRPWRSSPTGSRSAAPGS